MIFGWAQVFTLWARGIKRYQQDGGLRGKGVPPHKVRAWAAYIADMKIFPTTDKRWCSLSQGLYINDDDELARPFLEAQEDAPVQDHTFAELANNYEFDKDAARAHAAKAERVAAAESEMKTKSRVNFMHIPTCDARSHGRMQYFSDVTIQPFLEALGIPKLSASVKVETILSGTIHYDNELPNLVADLFPFVQLWLFRKRGREEYLELEQSLSGQDRSLADFQCMVTSKVSTACPAQF